MDVEANVATYLAARSPTDRYASFDYCFNYFRSFHSRGETAMLASPAHLQESCLQVGFYLASWGMFRGGTVLLDRSLRYLVPVVQAIGDAPDEIWSIDADKYDIGATTRILDWPRHCGTPCQKG